jgi:hypothetical protein
MTRPQAINARAHFRPRVRRIVALLGAKVPTTSLTRHHFPDTVIGEGGGTAPHPFWAGDRKDTG